MSSWLDDDPEWQELKARIEGEPYNNASLNQHIVPSVNNTEESQESFRQKIVALIRRLRVVVYKGYRLARIVAVKVYNKIKLFLEQKNIPTKYTPAVPVVILLFAVTGVFLLKPSGSGNAKKPNQSQEQGVLSQQKVDPEYKVLEPTVSEGAERDVRYDPERRVASFTDYIGTEQVTISMQPLPQAFEEDPIVHVEKLAKEFNATDKIAESNPVAFTGKNDNGVQTTLFSKNGLLVFILAQREVDRQDLAAYITALE
jgi:hypothetical protein